MKVRPFEQFIGEIIGAAVSSAVITFLFFIFFNIYKNIGPMENSDLIVLQGFNSSLCNEGNSIYTFVLAGTSGGTCTEYAQSSCTYFRNRNLPSFLPYITCFHRRTS